MCVHRSRSMRGELDCWLARTYMCENTLGENVTGISLNPHRDYPHRASDPLNEALLSSKELRIEYGFRSSTSSYGSDI